MVRKVKEKLKKTRNIENNLKFEKYNLREERILRYYKRVLSNQQKHKSIP